MEGKILLLRNIVNIVSLRFLRRLVLLVCILSFDYSFSQINSDEFCIEIKEFASGWESFVFSIKTNKIQIFKYTPFKGGYKRKKLFSKKIDLQEMSIIKQRAEQLKNLDSQYIQSQIGGIRWEINVMDKNMNKKIIVENMKKNEIQELFDTINSIIPKGIPLIESMDSEESHVSD